MINLEARPNQLLILNLAFSQLCPPNAPKVERDRVQLLLFELMYDDGLMTVESLVARGRDLLEIHTKMRNSGSSVVCDLFSSCEPARGSSASARASSRL